MKRSQLSSRTYFLFYTLCAAMFITVLNQNIYSPLIPLLKAEFGVTIHLINLISGLFILCFALMQLFLGQIVDRYRQDRLFIGMMVLVIISTFLVGFTKNFTLFFIFRIIQALSSAGLPLLAVKAATQFSGAKKDDALATYQLILSFAPAIAPFIGAYIGDYFHYSLLFYGLMILSLVLLFVGLVAFKRLSIFTEQPNEFNESTESVINHQKMITERKKEPLNLLQSPLAIYLLLISALFFLCYFAILIHLPMQLTIHYGIALSNSAYLYLALTGSMIAGSLLFKKLPIKRRKNPRLLIIVPIVLMVAILLYTLFGNNSLIILALTLAIIGFSLGLLPILSSVYLTDLYPEATAQVMARYNLFRYLGMGTGGAIAGVTVLPLIFIIAITIIALAIIIVIQQEPLLIKVEFK